MADSILRLKVDSQEYDQKIKRAAEGIQQYAQKCKDAGGTLQYLDDGVLEFVQALGKMDTVATGTKQQLREMSNALTTLTQTYRGLTDEEKASPFGQELAKGIQQLTERAGQAQDAMADVQASIRNAASDTRLFDQMAQGMSVATAGFQGLTGAGKLLGIEMGNDVEVIAKLQAAMAVTNSLTTIQTALQKQSALMQGLNAAKTSLAVVAQQAYAVATGEATVAQAAFNVVANANPYALLFTSIGLVVGAIGTFVAMTDDSEEAQKRWQETLKESENRVNNLAQAFTNLKYAMELRGASDKELVDAEIEALEKKRTELYGRLGNKDVSHDEWMQISKEIEKVNDEISKLINKRQTYVNQVNQLRKTGAIDTLNTDRELQKALSIAQAEKAQQKYGSWLYNYWDDLIVKINNKIKSHQTEVVKGTTTTTNTKGGTKSIEEEKDDFVEINGLIAQAEEHISNLQQRIKEAPDETTIAALKKDLAAANDELKRLNGIGSEVSTAALPPLLQMDSVLKQLNEDLNKAETPEAYQEILADIKAIIKEMKAFKGETDKGKGKDKKSGKKYDKSFDKEFSNIVGGVSSIVSGIQQMGVEIPKELQSVLGVLSGISSIMTGITALLTLIQIDTKTTAVASTADALFPLANGGIVPHAASGILMGRSFSGDNIGNVRLNAGELVLNKAQQYTLSQQLTDGGFSGVQLDTVIGAEEIRLILNNNGRRTGRGEYVQNRNRRF